MNNKKNDEELQVKIDCYSDTLFKIALLRLQNTQDAEDVVQEVFYQYIRRAEEFESNEHEKAWLIKVTLNACRKIWRNAWNRHRSDQEEWDTYCPKTVENGSDGLEEGILTVESNRILLTAVRELPAKYRDVIHLYYYEELSVKEIAVVTGRKDSTVTSQLTRGRELLKKRLKEAYDFA